MSDFTLNIPISKVDAEERMVWGYATTEDLDSQGDIVDYDASKKAFGDWIGNIREMHQPIAVGKAIDIQFDDEDRKVMIGVKVSESADGQNAWTKVQEGVLTGFSIGGKVFKTVRDTVKVGDATKTINRVVDYALSETSLVDNPACPGAQFVMVKSVDGGLQRVEEEETPTAKGTPVAWWVKSYMPTIETAQKLYDADMSKGTAEVKKSMWDAAWLLDLAIELGYYVNNEEYEGEDTADLKAALETIKEAVVKEITEPTETLTVAVELAQKTVNLNKGKTVSEETKKSNVVGGVERDHKAEVVNDETPKGEDNVQHQEEPVSDPAAPAAEAPAEPADKGGSKDEPAKSDKKTTEDKTDKSNEVADLVKSLRADIAKLGDTQPTNDLQKSVDALGAKVDSKFAELEKRVSQMEGKPMPTKAKASFVEVTKGEQPEAADLVELQKRSDHLVAHPEDAKPGEIEELTQKMRKASQATMKKEN